MSQEQESVKKGRLRDFFKPRNCQNCGFRMGRFQLRCEPCGWRVPHATLYSYAILIIFTILTAILVTVFGSLWASEAVRTGPPRRFGGIITAMKPSPPQEKHNQPHASGNPPEAM